MILGLIEHGQYHLQHRSRSRWCGYELDHLGIAASSLASGEGPHRSIRLSALVFSQVRYAVMQFGYIDEIAVQLARPRHLKSFVKDFEFSLARFLSAGTRAKTSNKVRFS